LFGGQLFGAAVVSGIIDRLEQMQFKLTPRVNSSKLTAFVNEIKESEVANHP
jgi:hypothetical protein